MNQAAIPIIVGVTGHRQIDAASKDRIYAGVKRTLQQIQAAYPHSPVCMLNSLAEGADLLCARAAEELNMDLLVVLPMEKDEYRRDFSEEAAALFDHYCQKAAKLFVSPRTEKLPQNPSRDFYYRQASIYTASHSHLLIALWDGMPGKENGCGTAETVEFAIKGHYHPESGIALRSRMNEAVVHIFTPRTQKQAEKAGAITLIGDQDTICDILKKTDDFNARAARFPEAEFSPAGGNAMAQLCDHLYGIADALSSSAARKYKRILGLSSVVSSLFALFFLLYDEANIIWMILLCGLMLSAMAGCLVFAKKSDCHFQYVEYRVLAEYLRVQSYLFTAGSDVRTANLMPWSQQCENSWIMVALCAVTIGVNPKRQLKISEDWIHQQQLYHQAAITSTKKKVDRNNRIISIAMFFSVFLYIAALLYEMIYGDLFFASTMDPNYSDLIRNTIKIFLGLASAGTMFIANYYGKIALDRRLTDHEKMVKFFGKLYDSISVYGQTEELLEYLAREELIENGNWYSYQINNKLDLSV